MIRRRAIAAVAILVAACSSTSPSPSGPVTVPAGLEPDHVLVAIDDASNWPGLGEVEDPRLITLTADGMLVVRMPNGARLPVAQTRLDRVALDTAWAAVVRSGTATNATFDLPGAYDVNTTTIRVDDGSRSTKLSIYALGGTPTEGAFDADEARLRGAAGNLVSELGLLAGSDAWTPPAVLLWIEEPGEGLMPRAAPWTPHVDLATAGAPVENQFFDRCVRIDGQAAVDVTDFVRGLPSDVRVEQAGRSYGIAVRPIYPDQLDDVQCP